MKSFTFLCFICVLTLYFAQKLFRKIKNCSRLLEPEKVAPNVKSSSKVVEHNREDLIARGRSDSFVHVNVLEKGSDCHGKAFLKSQAFPAEAFFALVGGDSPR